MRPQCSFKILTPNIETSIKIPSPPPRNFQYIPTAPSQKPSLQCISFFFPFFFFLPKYLWLFFPEVCMHNLYIWCLEESVRSPQNGVTKGFQLSYTCQKLNLGPLEPVLTTAESSLQSCCLGFQRHAFLNDSRLI